MAKHVTQKTFDDAVWENIKEFDMEPQEAIDDAIQQFTAQVRHGWLELQIFLSTSCVGHKQASLEF